MSFRSHSRRESIAIEASAEEWLGRRDGGLDLAQEAELSQWLRADPRHAAAFGRLTATAKALDQLSLFRPGGHARPDPDIPLRHRPKRFGPLPMTLAAAAALALAYIGWWRPTSGATSYSCSAITEIGGLRTLSLPDGSVVTINTDSALEIQFTKAERHIVLRRGEANFTVAKNPRRPFVVETQGVAVRAVGTAFDVRLRPESVDVLVTEGRVRVLDVHRGTSLVGPEEGRTSSPAGSPMVTASEQAEISLKPHARVLPPKAMTAEKIAQLLAWQSRKLEFDPMSLSALVAEFNRYNRQKLVVSDPALADLKIGGTFRSDDYEAFVRLLESTFGVEAERSHDGILLRRRH